MSSAIHRAGLLCLLAALSTIAQADRSDDIANLQSRWAEINYQLPEAQREEAFKALSTQAEALRTAHPKDTAYLIWEGIIRSTYAGAKGGLGALGEVKKAKALFEESIALDPAALDGSAVTSLGSLYYQVPGWPVGFGDDDKAQALLLQGLSYSPDGIDANYFYGDFLLEQKQYAEAKTALEKALASPPRPGRESADAGRRAEIEQKLQLVRSKLN